MLLRKKALIILGGFVLVLIIFWAGYRMRPWLKGAQKKLRITNKAVAPDLELLQEIGYIEGTYDPNVKDIGVLIYDHKKAYSGYNLYNSKSDIGTQLIDMTGKILHRWERTDYSFGNVQVFPNGDLLVLQVNYRIMKLNVNSEILWTYDVVGHHDFFVCQDDGRIFLLGRIYELRPDIHPSLNSVVDKLVILTSTGQFIEEISLLDLMINSPYAFLLPRVNHNNKHLQKSERAVDLLHTNHVEVFDGRLSEQGRIYEKGNILLSFRNISTILILDGTSREIIWIWGPSNLTYQHQPTLLENGNLLIFDNGLKQSRVIELNPMNFEIVWEYTSSPEEFFTEKRGSNQRLPNGNTLITESERGYVFEVTPNKDIVWRFANPEFTNEQERLAIWRMTRIDPEYLTFLIPEETQSENSNNEEKPYVR